MKKKLVSIILIIVLLLVASYVLRYKLGLNFSEKVPTTATEIIHVNLRKIEQQLLADFVKHPFAYIQLKASKKKHKRSFLKEIDLPKNMLFFKNDSNFKGAWYSSVVKIKDSTSFSLYLVGENFTKTADPDLTVFSKKNLLVALKGKRLILIFKYNKQADVLRAAASIFNETNFLPIIAPLLATLSNTKSVMYYASGSSNFLEVDFKKGFFEIHGVLASDLFKSEVQAESVATSVASMSFVMNKNGKDFNTIKQYINNTRFNEITHLSVDSIFNKWTGAINFKLTSIHSKLDTIISYAYDDDFNKVEKVSTQKVVQPDFSLQMKSENDRQLFDYLFDERAIQIVEEDTLFVSMPLYTLYAQSIDTSLYISSNKSEGLQEPEKIKSKLTAFFDIEKYLKNQLNFFQLPAENKVLKQLQSVSIQLSEENDLILKVTAKNKNRNSLGQLITTN